MKIGILGAEATSRGDVLSESRMDAVIFICKAGEWGNISTQKFGGFAIFDNFPDDGMCVFQLVELLGAGGVALGGFLDAFRRKL